MPRAGKYDIIIDDMVCPRSPWFRAIALAIVVLICMATTYTVTMPDWIHQIKNKPIDDVRAYQFLPQFPNITLNATFLNAVPLNPCPLGVSGTDTNHYLYISDGGSSEAVLIVGGSCLSGQTSGTVIFVPAQAHSGSGWSLLSATAGLQEAFNVSQAIIMPPGTYDFYAGVTPPTSSSVYCPGISPPGQTVINYHPLTGEMFHIINNSFSIEGCDLEQIGTPTSSVGVSIHGDLPTSGGYTPGHSAANGRVTWVTAHGFYHGFVTDGGTSLWEFFSDWSITSIGDGIIWGDTQGHIVDCVSEYSQTGNGITFQLMSNGDEEPVPWVTGLQVFSNYGWGVYAANASFHISGMVNYFGNDRLGELYTNYHYTSLCDNCTFAESGKPGNLPSVQWPINTTAVGVMIDSNAAGITINNGLFGGIEGTCYKVQGVINTIVNSTFLGGQDGCGLGGVSGNIYAIDVGGGTNALVGQLQVIDNVGTSNPVRLSGDGLRFTHNIISMNENSVPLVEILYGQQVDFESNYLFNATGPAFACDGGFTPPGSVPGTLVDHGNVIASGSISNSCNGQAEAKLVGITVPFKTVSTLPPAGLNTGTFFWVTDGTAGNPCTGSGTGAFAVSNGSSWICK